MIHARLVQRCPVCGSPERRDLGGASSFDFGPDPARPQTHPAYRAVECGGCGLVYKAQTVTAEALGDYYDTLDYQPFNLPGTFPTDEALLANLRRLPEGSRVLDYGCSTGRLLQALGSNYDRYGVEVNEPAAEVARSRGVTILSDEALDGVPPFDAIMLTDVFEHLVDPTEALQRITRRLAPGGMLLLVTGLADAVEPHSLIAEHWYFRIPGHLQMLSLRSLDWIAEELGLTVERAEVMSHYRASPIRRLRQAIQLACYRLFREEPASTSAAWLRRAPYLNRAEHWENMPPTDARADHVVATLKRARVQT